MPMIRATYFFKDSAGAGWSETFFMDVANLTEAIAGATRMVSPRVELLGRDSSLEYVRVSDDLIKRDSQVYVVPEGDKSPVRGTVSELANNDLVIRIEGGTTFKTRRSLALRGIPTRVTGAAGKFNNNPAFVQSFNNWFKAAKLEKFAIKYRDKTVPILQITNVVQDVATGIVTVTTVGNHNFVAGDIVFITHVAGAIEVNGNWVVLAAPSATSFTIRVTQLVKPYVLSGQANKNAYLLAQFTTATIIRVATHRAGVPFDRLRGRRSGR